MMDMFFPDPASAHAGSIDRVVDIVDARDLALHLREGNHLEDRWDVNRDGAIDVRDVDAAAYEAVRIDR